MIQLKNGEYSIRFDPVTPENYWQALSKGMVDSFTQGKKEPSHNEHAFIQK